MHGTHRHLGEVLPKLRYRECGQAPAAIELTNSQTHGASGIPPSAKEWAIDLSRYAGPRRAEMACRPVGGRAEGTRGR